MTKAKDVEAAVNKAEDQFGNLHIMFNNAGISHANDDNAEVTTEEVFSETLKVNMNGVWRRCIDCLR